MSLLAEEASAVCKQQMLVFPELHLMYRDKNIGCKYGPYGSISWFFNHEEEGVILEDDCVPDLIFFPFVREMLVKYRNDNRISMIAGHSEVSIPLSTSYVFPDLGLVGDGLLGNAHGVILISNWRTMIIGKR